MHRGAHCDHPVAPGTSLRDDVADPADGGGIPDGGASELHDNEIWHRGKDVYNGAWRKAQGAVTAPRVSRLAPYLSLACSALAPSRCATNAGATCSISALSSGFLVAGSSVLVTASMTA